MFGWALEETPPLVKYNPVRDVRRVENVTDGFHTWTIDEVRQFEDRHPIGTQARLALALLLFTGVRRGDLVELGPKNVRNGWLRFVPNKTRYKRATETAKPVLEILTRIIEASPRGLTHYLVTQYGKPFTDNGFGNWFRDLCNEAGLPHCTAHGLRKCGASLAAENGTTVNQLMAIYDWSTPAQAKVYTDKADRMRLAGEAMHMLASGHEENELDQ
jgi:integrase